MNAVPASQLLSESILTLAAAARTIPGHRMGAACNPSTLWRWGRKGVRRADGQIVHLGLARLGGKWVTSREALQRFTDALTPAVDSIDPALIPTTAQRQRANDRAARELERMGV